jgi:hypothetical protein
MFERSELRSRREGRGGNGVKNLKGSEAIPDRAFISSSYLQPGINDQSAFSLLESEHRV